MAAPLCEPGDVAEMLGINPGYQGAELTQVARLCMQVSGSIRGELPLIDAWITAGQVDPDVVSGVACLVVARVKTALAMGGVTQSEEFYRDSLTAAAAALVLTAGEVALLTPPTSEPARAFTIRPGAVPLEYR